MNTRPIVGVTGGFDDLKSADIRFLEEASKLGPLQVGLWSDEIIQRRTGKPPKFPEMERLYLLRSIRYVSNVELFVDNELIDTPPSFSRVVPSIWAIHSGEASSTKQAACRAAGMKCCVITPDQLRGFPKPLAEPISVGRKKVIVTGCYDWFHSGHVRFFEEVSEYGALFVVVGHDANIRHLKGAGHPLIGQEERRYVCGAVRFVQESMISSGMGWLDADPEIQKLKPDIYAVNEDGDKGGKAEYCARNGIQYLVLKRKPAEGLPRRSSTDLRGF